MPRHVVLLALLLTAGCGAASAGVPPPPPPPPAPAVGSPDAAPPVGAAPAVEATPAAPRAAASTSHATAARAVRTCAPGVRRVTGARTAVALSATRAVVARRRPSPAAPVVARLPEIREHGLRTVLLGLDKVVDARCRATWYRVRLPQRPNGLVGWVPAAQVAGRRVDVRVHVDVGARTLTVLRRGRRVLRVPVAVGAPGTPTPLGAFYVDRRFKLRDPGGVFGPAILAVAAYSEAPQGWARDNPIAVHGTNAPSSIGRAASAGCIRVRNADVLRLLALVPSGTPVTIAS